MTFYLVKAKVKNNIFKLHQEMESGKIKNLFRMEILYTIAYNMQKKMTKIEYMRYG